MENTKTKTILAGVFIAVVTFIGLSSFTSGKVTAYTSNSDGEFKNLKVLPQDISRDSLMNLMKGYNIALGVDCSFCHVPTKRGKDMDFVSDEKPEKGYARSMITMTNELNVNYFNWEKREDPSTITRVTCVLCHRGTAKPIKYLENMNKVAPSHK
ncbi:MAG: c-type cytochrome [Brumimicrobium sp.]